MIVNSETLTKMAQEVDIPQRYISEAVTTALGCYELHDAGEEDIDDITQQTYSVNDMLISAANDYFADVHGAKPANEIFDEMALYIGDEIHDFTDVKSFVDNYYTSKETKGNNNE